LLTNSLNSSDSASARPHQSKNILLAWRG